MLVYRDMPVREQFELPGETVYLRCGNICPAARCVREAMESFLRVWAQEGDRCWELATLAYENARQRFARLIGARPGELATCENTSMGLSLAAALVAPQPGSNVVVDELTHPCNVLPWKRPGVQIRYARADGGRVDLDAFTELVDERTAAIDVCHVTMAHGFRHDLEALGRLAHAHGAFLVVDAAQSAGVVPLDVDRMQVDFLACPTFKWLFGPLGAGFLFVRGDLVNRQPPAITGWMGLKHPERFDIHELTLHDDARRLQRGVHNAVGLVGASAGLDIIDQVGIQPIWDHVRGLAARLIDGLAEQDLRLLTEADEQQRGSIITIAAEDAGAAQAALAGSGIQVGHYLPGQIRMDVAPFHSESDIDRTLTGLEQVASSLQRGGRAR